MIHRSLLVFSSASVLTLLATPAREVLAQPSSLPAVVSTVEEPATKLEKYMEEINKGFRKLRADLKDKQKNDESLALVRTLQDTAGKCRLEKPAKLADVKKDEQAQFVLEFQKSMIELSHRLLDLEEALLDGDNEKAGQVRDEINQMKSTAHKQFKADDDEEGGRGEGRGPGRGERETPPEGGKKKG